MRNSVIAPVALAAGIGLAAVAGVALLLHDQPTLWAFAGVALLAAAALIGTIVYSKRRISDRLRRMTRTLHRAATTDLVVRCDEGGDEIGELSREINLLLQKVTDLNVNVIDTDRELQWTQKELGLKEELAAKSRLLQATNEQLERRLQELSLLFSVSRAVSASIELDPLLETFCNSGARAMEADRFCVCVYDERHKALVVRGQHGFDDRDGAILGMRVYPGEGISGTVYEKKTMIYVRDLDKDQRFLHFRGKARLSGSLLALPLTSGDQCVGVLLLHRDRIEAFSFEDVGLFHIIANQVAGAVSNALLYQKTRDLSVHDELTGLYNRRMLERRLEMEWERSRRFGTTLACIMVDVDHFKQFNDEHGHLVGDEVLRHTGKLLGAQIRSVDSVARFGGEEFAILLPRTEKGEAQAVAEKLRSAMEGTPFTAAGRDDVFHLTVSAGVASTEDAPTSAKQLIDLADHALLVAKSAGRNRVEVYGESGGGHQG